MTFPLRQPYMSFRVASNFINMSLCRYNTIWLFVWWYLETKTKNVGDVDGDAGIAGNVQTLVLVGDTSSGNNVVGDTSSGNNGDASATVEDQINTNFLRAVSIWPGHVSM